MKKVIQLKKLSKIYNPDTIPVKAVHEVDLEIAAGEFTVIVGASGSGKTTLLNLVGGIDVPTSGEVWIDGKLTNDMTEREITRFRRDHIGFVFQNFNLLPVLTAKENTAFVMELQGIERSQREARSLELLSNVGLAEKVDVRPAKLSGGQQQRVAVARALSHKPKFVLADEPTASLDSKSTAGLLDIMLDLNEKEGITFLFSTHDQRVVDRARRIIEFEDGRIKSDKRL